MSNPDRDIVRGYRPADRSQVAGLLRRLWSHDAGLNEAYLIWRYEQNPYLVNAMAVAEYAGRIVAVRGSYGMRWRIGDRAELIPCLGDTVVAREHEGRRLVQRLSRHLFAELGEQGVRCVVNQSPGKLVEKISLRTGWRRVGDRKLTRCSDPHAPLCGFQNLDANAARDAEQDHRLVVQADPPVSLIELLAKRQSIPPISHLVDREYIRWRFRNPLSQYRWVCAYRGDELVGFLLLARSVGRIKVRFRILDMWGIDSAIQSTLLRRTLDWGRFPNLYVWWNRFPREVVQVLLDRGFEATAADVRNPTILIRFLDGESNSVRNGVDLLNIANWDARMIHSDVT